MSEDEYLMVMNIQKNTDIIEHLVANFFLCFPDKDETSTQVTDRSVVQLPLEIFSYCDPDPRALPVDSFYRVPFGIQS